MLVKFPKYRELIYIAAAACGMTMFVYLTPPLQNDPLALLANLPGDLPVYLQRFGLSVICLGVLPFFAALLCGETPKTLGFSRFGQALPARTVILFTLAGVPLGVLGVLGRELSTYYPYSKTILEWTARESAAWFLLHGFLYFFLYYLPWEFVFRGLLILPLIKRIEVGMKPGQGKAVLVIVASLQAIPSALLHFGHPAVETLGAVFFGIFLGYLVVKTRSILPGLIIHFTVGIFLDIAILARYFGGTS